MRSTRIILLIFIPLILVGFIVSTLYKWNYLQHSQHLPDEFNIPNLYIGYDANKNRVDDSKDIVDCAKEYTSHNPKWEPFKEYSSGFPPVGRGSNGDVIAYAFNCAGYNLKSLVYQDIQKNPEAYPNDSVHSENGAFRDVKNLRVFFSRYGEEATNDYYSIREWQTGDVVFFEKNHSAVVADHVNDKGVRFIIHLFWEHQAGYYQDVLETNAWGKVIGHYRATSRMLSPKTDAPGTKQNVHTELNVD